MKTSKIILLLILVISSISISGFVEKTGKKKGSAPQYQGEIIIPGLICDVLVCRDIRGMPHLYAENEHDLYFATGFVMAQERLWQMDLIRRSSTGRLSEIFGKSYVRTDLLFRNLNISAKSKLVLKDEDPEILQYLQAFTDGVNFFIGTAGKNLPPEFRILSYFPEPWQLEDIVNIIGVMGWGLGETNFKSELFEYRLLKKLGIEKAIKLIPDGRIPDNFLFPDFKIDDKLISAANSFISSEDKYDALGINPFSSSNNWVLSGHRTVSGKPLFANDMHLTLSSPGIWMQMHQIIPGKLNVSGVLIPGEPFIVAGHNENIAWGLTNMRVDNIDLFAEKINPEDQNQYYHNGLWNNMESRDEIIKVKRGIQDTFRIKFTCHGPVISGLESIDDISLTMRWTGQDISDEIGSLYLLNRASCWKDFRIAISTFRTLSQNFAYADTEGNIGLSTGGGIPVRKFNMNIIRDGETDEYDWKGYVPFEQMPFSFNPHTGYVSSANNKTVDKDYPYYINSYFALPYRINRINQMLDEKEIFNIGDFMRMINDQHSDYAALLTPFIANLSKRPEKLTYKEIKALSVLSGWDYEMNAELIAPTIFEFFRISFLENLLSDELGDLYEGIYDLTGEYYIYRILKTGGDEMVDNIHTSAKESLEDIILLSFKDCVKSLSLKLGENQTRWKWGRIHKITIKHPICSTEIMNMLYGYNSKEYQAGGSDHTVKPFYSGQPGFKVNIGASQRHILNTADWDESYTIIPTGESGIPGSEFYLSQTTNYINGDFYKDAFSEKAVRAVTKYTLLLRSEK